MWIRRALLLIALVLVGAVAGAPAASAKVTLGPDVTTPAPSGGLNVGAYGCQGGAYSPCLFINMESTNPAIPVVSPIDGVITKWRFRAGCCTDPQTETKTLTLVTFAKGVSFGYPSGVIDQTGTSYELRPGDQLLSSSPPELPARLPITTGERFGIVADSPIAFSADGTLGGITSSVMANGYIYNGQRYGNAMNAAIIMSVDIEPDADHDGYGDETQDCKPDDPAVHDTGCAPEVVTSQPSYIPPLSVAINCPSGGSCSPPPGSPPPTPVPTPTPPPIVLAPLVGAVPASSDGTRFNVVLGCPKSAAGPCTGVLILNPAGGTKAQRLAAAAAAASFGTATYSVAPGKTSKLLVKLNSAGRKALKRKGKLQVRLTVQPTGGTPTSVTRTLKAKKPAKHH